MAQTGDDWAVQAADTIERVVTGVRDKTTVPIITVARVLVFGLLAAVMGAVALILFSVGLVRVLDTYLTGPLDSHARAVWVTEAGLGGIFTLAGLFLWTRRRTPQ
ncbi:MAG TPA: hypothetical protein VFA94_07070 [Acidimicrobiales bacterium]|nr:hypothetical protein [Acidimicrobiales bacterium]